MKFHKKYDMNLDMKLQITPEEKKFLKKQQKSTKDKNEYIKISVILFLNAGLLLDKIAEDLGVNINTLFQNIKNFTNNLNL